MGSTDAESERKRKVTPLPTRELSVLCGLVACAMFSFAVIYPFLPFLVGCEYSHGTGPPPPA